MNKYPSSYFIVLFTLTASPALGQLQKTLHQSFAVPDSTKMLIVNLPDQDDWEVIPWAGNSIMTESNIKMYSANKGIFNHFMEKGRYDYLTLEQGDSLSIVGKDTKRLVIKAGELECSEVVDVRIFIPDTYQELSYGIWTRPDEAPDTRKDKARIKKKLDREKIDVSGALKESIDPIKSEADSSVKEGIPPLDTPKNPGDFKKEKTEKDDKGTGN
jgi:hypothetical protein